MDPPMTSLAQYQTLGRRLERARSAGDSEEVVRLEAELRLAPPVIRYLYLGDAPPPTLGATPSAPADQLEQLLAQVRAPTSTPAAPPREVWHRAAQPNEPRAAIAARPFERAATARRSAGVAGLCKVLAVDQDEQILGSWARAARDRNIVTAVDAVTARQLASTQRPDLAIVDLRLGNTSGIDLIRALKRDVPDLLAVLCSGYLSVAAAVAAVRAGADIVVFKPITFSEILQRIEESIEAPDLEDTPTLARAEWEHIMRVLADCNGNVSMAARRLGIYRNSLQRRLRKYAPRS
jgi:two-component system response regulator RegA